jgi:hypothetical protein
MNAETRWAWCACVLAVAGCNQIFGNNSVTPLDADIGEAGIDARYGAMTVMYAVEAGPDQIGTSPTYVPFDTQVHVGAMDTHDPDVSKLELRPVTNGGFTVRFETLASRYRLIFTAPDGVDVEIQSQLSSADFVVPRIGRIDRGTALPGSLIPFMFTNGPDSTMVGSWKQGKIFSTGLWASFDLGPCCSGGQLSGKVDYQRFTSMSGPLGVPTSATDKLIFVDHVGDGGGTLDANHNKVYGYATVTVDGFDDSGAPINMIASPWKDPIPQTKLGVTTTAFAPDFAQRVAGLLNLTGTAVESPEIRKAGGVIAAANIMPFTEILLNQLTNIESVNGDLDHVVFVGLGHTPGNPISFVNPFNGTDAPAYPTAVMVSGSAVRTFANSTANVRNGIQALALQTDGAPNVNIGDAVGYASTIKIKPTSVTDESATVVLLDDPDAKMLKRNDVASMVKTFDLWFSSDTADVTATIDDCSITVYEVGPTTLTPTKRYLTNDMPTESVPLQIDQSVFQPARTYTLGFSCYHGHPMAKLGDWRTVTFPFAASTIYTKSFVVP